MPPALPPAPDEAPLSRRERQLMDVLHRRASATAREIHSDLRDAPSYSTVRTLLAVLMKKGHLTTAVSGRSLVYRPALQRKAAAASALRRLVRTFFDGSVANAVSGLLSLREQRLTPEELVKLEQWIADQKPGPDSPSPPPASTATSASAESRTGSSRTGCRTARRRSRFQDIPF